MVDCYNPSLVLVQPRKTPPYITERLLMGRKESNQTNKSNKQNLDYSVFNLERAIAPLTPFQSNWRKVEVRWG